MSDTGQLLQPGARRLLIAGLRLFHAGNASQVAQLLLASAEATVARGEPSVFGSDNIANRTNDISGAVALAATVNQSRLARSQVDDGLSAAIAQGLVESSEAAAVLIASAMMVDNSTATAVAAAGITQVGQIQKVLCK